MLQGNRVDVPTQHDLELYRKVGVASIRAQYVRADIDCCVPSRIVGKFLLYTFCFTLSFRIMPQSHVGKKLGDKFKVAFA